MQVNAEVPCWVDLYKLLEVAEQLESMASGQFAAHFALWQGHLLSDFYADWVMAEREYYQGRLLRLALQAIQQLRARSAYPQAIALGQQLLSFDPTNEPAHQQVIFCYMAAGDRTAALRQYDLCERALAEELDLPPSPETAALYQWIKTSDAEDAGHHAKITNLPIPLTSFVGRIAEMTTIKRLLNPAEGATRLLTITGAGGSGKTRLAIQAATDLVDHFAQGVWWVELAALTEGEFVARAVAKTLGVTETPSEPLLETVAAHLRTRQLLLVLDNCEYLVDPVAHLVDFLLSRCPQLQILTTSRVPLNISGEILWQTPTMSLPDPQQILMAELLMPYESVRLFVERATALQPTFRLTLENAGAVVEICRQLDGIPLAIELAAARVKILPVEQIAAYLKGAIGARFALLTQGNRAGLPRQQTLRAAVDWSYELLDDAERLLFRQLAVFRGGFTLEALGQVAIPLAGGAFAIHHLLDLLTQLVDQSLVLVELHSGQNRYRMLETLREYALERWIDSPDLEAIQGRHAIFFAQLVEEAAPALVGAEQLRWLNRLESDYANLLAAMDYWVGEGGDRPLLMTSALSRFWDTRGYISEGRTWLAKALHTPRSATLLARAKALNAAGWLAYRQSDYQAAYPLLTEGYALFAQGNDELGAIEALQNLAIVEMRLGNYQSATQRIEQSLLLSRTIQHDRSLSRALNLLGNLALDQGRHAEARASFLESTQICEQLGDQENIAAGHMNIGIAAHRMGHFAAARAEFETALTISRALGHKGLTGVVLRNLGRVALEQGDFAAARAYSEEALTILRLLDDKSNIGFTLAHLGLIARRVGDPQLALAYYRENLQLVFAVGHQRAIAAALENIAHLLSSIGQHQKAAVRFLGAAARLRQAISIPVAPNEQAEYEQTLAALRQHLTPTLFAAHWEEGQAAPLDAVVTEALELSGQSPI
ncbi:MAG: tetratricopeptide repeat protein [Caldilineaceae bacterium]